MIEHLKYQTTTVCFACGRRASAPCPGHEYGGLLRGQRLRRPWRWLLRLPECPFFRNRPQ